MDSSLMTANTHPVQIYAMTAMFFLNTVGLFLLNRYKKSHVPPRISWEKRRTAFWVLIFTSVAFSCYLDVYFYIDAKVMYPIKSYLFAFPLGLLDLYFSETRGVPMKVTLGAALWCSTNILRNFVTEKWFGHSVDTVVILQELTISTVPTEIARYVCSLLGVGLLSDLIFSPLHRACHKFCYQEHHKFHHEYTNKLTALVLYHGSLLDDFLMPLTTTVGGFLYILILNHFGFMGEAFSNLTGYIIIFNTLLSHAHDVRCSRLLAPLPDELNFVAYHYVHHLSPGNNFGLTEPSDQLWDFLLGVKTIVKLDDSLKDRKKVN